MSARSLVRRAVWTGLEFVRGRPILSHVPDIAAAFEEPDAARARSRKKLKALIEHACMTTEHYGELSGAEELDDFPVLHKRQIGQDHDGFVSSAYSRDCLVPVKTSGSYGTPFTFLLTPEKKARQRAEVIYFSGWCGYRVGDRHGLTVGRPGRKSRWRLFLQNEVLLCPAKLDGVWLEEARQTLLRGGLEVIIGFPSAIGVLALYCRSRGDEAERFDSLRCVITYAEALQPAVQDLIREVFGCRVMSRYAAEEFGVLAQECERGNHHLNTASYVIELLRLESADAAGPDQVGRVLVTDLYSQAMPLIRYDTGDLAIGGEGCACGRGGPLFSSLHGRTVEVVIDPRGQRLLPYALTAPMKDFEGILQYQFAQVARRCYELRLCVLPAFRSEAQVRRRLVAVLGEAADLRIRYVHEIPPLPSGKRPYVVNEWRRARAA